MFVFFSCAFIKRHKKIRIENLAEANIERKANILVETIYRVTYTSKFFIYTFVCITEIEIVYGVHPNPIKKCFYEKTYNSDLIIKYIQGYDCRKNVKYCCIVKESYRII